MLILELVAASIVVFLVCAFFQLPIIIWTLAYAGVAVLTQSIPVMVAYAVVALVFNIPFLRKALFTNHVLAVYRRILPSMSSTEKEAIDAGTVWWDADLFSGHPDWNKLLATPAPKLSAEEQAFLDGPVEELCAICNDWEITHEHQDLPPHVWQFIKDKGFLGMIIPKDYGGLGFSALAQDRKSVV